MKLSRFIAAAAVAVGLISPAVTSAPANAAPAGNIVTLGDSYTANPDEIRNTIRDIPAKPVQDYVWRYPNKGGCLQAPNNWPRQLGAKVGAPVADWSCTAQTSQSMLGRIDAAIRAGDLHAGTRAVVIAVGMNDYGPFGISQGFQPLNPGAMSVDYINNIKAATAKVRSVAPGAKIVLSGSLAVAEPAAPNMFCPVNVVPGAPGGTPLPPLAATEVHNEARQRDAALAVGATFVEMRQASAGHTSCNPNASQRYVAGAVDTTTPGKTMSMHPSAAGSAFIASRLAPVV